MRIPFSLSMLLALMTSLFPCNTKAQNLQADTTQARQLYSQAVKLSDQKQPQKAGLKFAQAASLYKNHQIKELYINCKSLEGLAYAQRGYTDTALVINKSLQADCYGLDTKVCVKLMMRIGSVFSAMRKYDSTLVYLKKGLTLQTEDNPLKASLYNSLSGVYYYLGQANMAVDYAKQALQILEKQPTKDPFEWIDTYCLIAQLEAGSIDVLKDRAATALKMAQPYADKDPSILLQPYHLKFLYHYLNKQPEKAIEYLKKSKEINSELYGEKSEIVASDLLNIGVVYKDNQITKKGEEYLLKAIELYQELGLKNSINLSIGYRNLAFLYTEQMNQHQKALEIAQKGVTCLLPGFQPKNNHDLPNLTDPKLTILNKETLERALEAKEYTYQRLYDDTKELKYLMYSVKHISNHEKLLQQIYNNAVSKEDQAGVLSRMHKLYRYVIEQNEKMYAVDPQEKYLNDVLKYMSKNKTVFIQNNMRSGQAFDKAGVPPALSKQEKDFKTRIASTNRNLQFALQENNQSKINQYQKEVFQLKRQHEDLQQKIAKDYPMYQKLLEKEEYPTIKEIQEKLLEEKTAYIEYFTTDYSTHILTITKDKATVESKSSGYIMLADQLDKLREVLSDIEYTRIHKEEANQKFVDASYQLNQHLMELKGLDLKKVDRLIICPDHLLFYLPFEVLLQSKPSQTKELAYNQWDYLIKHAAISYTYSADLLLDIQARRSRGNGRIAAFAAHYDREALSNALRSPDLKTLRGALTDLPGARKEVEALQKQFKGRFFLNKEANETNFKNLSFGNFSVVHLALHGLMNQETPMTSSLAFSETNEESEDNFLYAHEIMHLDIPAELVVLSACETGIGKLRTGEGAVSLGTAFLYAGSSSLLMTLWEVNDDATAYLMEHFYKYLSEGMSKDKALQQAKMDYLDNSEGIMSHPFLWAAHVNIGSSSPIKVAKIGDFEWSHWYTIGIAFAVLLLGGFLFSRNRRSRESQ